MNPAEGANLSRSSNRQGPQTLNLDNAGSNPVLDAKFVNTSMKLNEIKMWKLQYTPNGTKAVPVETAFDYGCWIAPDSKIYHVGNSSIDEFSPHYFALQSLALHDIVKTNSDEWRIDPETDEEYHPTLFQKALEQGWIRVGLFKGILFFEGNETGFKNNVTVIRKLIAELRSNTERVTFEIDRRARSFQIPKQRIEMFTFLDSL